MPEFKQMPFTILSVVIPSPLVTLVSAIKYNAVLSPL